MKRREDEKFLDVNASMQGSLLFSDPVNLRINGNFEGNLTTKGNLIIGESARVNADIIGENISVAGKVRGKIKALQKIALLFTSEVNAEIESPKIIIEEGAMFNGSCKMPQNRMSLGELSDYLSVERDRIKDWVAQGKIPVEKAGSDLMFDLKEVELWMKKNS